MGKKYMIIMEMTFKKTLGLIEKRGIEWAAQEDFSELKGKRFNIYDTKAVDIMKLTDLSEVSKILLSAVAGAVIQYLIDYDFLDRLSKCEFYIV